MKPTSSLIHHLWSDDAHTHIHTYSISTYRLGPSGRMGRVKIINESPYLAKLSLDLILSKRRWSPFLILHIVLIIITKITTTIVIILGHPHLNYQDLHHHQCRDPDPQQWWYFHGVIWVDWNPQLLWNFPDDHPQPFTFRPSPLFQTIIYESFLIIDIYVNIIT